MHKTLSYKTETANLQDRDETETFNLQDRDKTRRYKKRLETASRPRRKTETFQKNVSTSRPQCRSLQTPTGEVSLDNVFLAGQIHYFLHDISASLPHCMDVHKTKVTRPRRYIFKTETLNSRDRDVRPSRPRRDDETFQKTSQDQDIQDQDYIPAYFTPAAVQQF